LLFGVTNKRAIGTVHLKRLRFGRLGTLGYRTGSVTCTWLPLYLMCIHHYARTVSEWTKDNTLSIGLRDMIRHFCDCLGRLISAL